MRTLEFGRYWSMCHDLLRLVKSGGIPLDPLVRPCHAGEREAERMYGVYPRRAIRNARVLR